MWAALAAPAPSRQPKRWGRLVRRGRGNRESQRIYLCRTPADLGSRGQDNTAAGSCRNLSTNSPERSSRKNSPPDSLLLVLGRQVAVGFGVHGYSPSDRSMSRNGAEGCDRHHVSGDPNSDDAEHKFRCRVFTEPYFAARRRNAAAASARAIPRTNSTDKMIDMTVSRDQLLAGVFATAAAGLLGSAAGKPNCGSDLAIRCIAGITVGLDSILRLPRRPHADTRLCRVPRGRWHRE